MIAYAVVYAPSAQTALAKLYDYIAEQTSPRIADGFVERLLDACESLADAPERGTVRDEYGRGLRTFGFEKRATILFRVEKRKRRVVVLDVLYGGRQIGARG
jgi:toxin ParE1/3/4